MTEGSRLTYQPALDGVRALSIAAVIGVHYYAVLPGGYIGVDVFFVLSGFLITTLLVQEWDETRDIRFLRFYRRRALRLFPALAVLLGAWMLYTRATMDAAAIARNDRNVLYVVLYVANWVDEFDVKFGGLAHTWSLAVEEQFYILWPLLLLLLLRARWTSPRGAVALVTLGVGLSALWRAVLWNATGDFPRIYAGLDTRADCLLIGCAGALAVRAGMIPSDEAGLARLRALGVAGLVWVVTIAVFGNWGEDFQRLLYFWGMSTLALPAVCAAIITVSDGRDWWLSRLLGAQPLPWVGRISYGLYLWHVPIQYGPPGVTSMRARYLLPAMLLATFACAAGSYYLIERPILRLRARLQ